MSVGQLNLQPQYSRIVSKIKIHPPYAFVIKSLLSV